MFAIFIPKPQLTHRADDNEESVSTRLATYDELTKPLLDYYENSGRLEKVSGEGSLEEIYQAIDKLIMVSCSWLVAKKDFATNNYHEQLTNVKEFFSKLSQIFLGKRMIIAKSQKDLDRMREVGELIAEVRETLRR